MSNTVLHGDLTDDDFVEIVGVPYDEYVRPVREARALLPPNADRNDIFRPYFHEVVGPPGDRSGLDAFYSDPEGLFCRLCAYEIWGGPGVTLAQLLDRGKIMFAQEEYAYALYTAASRFERVIALDHGCGPCHLGLHLAKTGARVVLHDYATPMRVLIAHGVRKYGMSTYASRVNWSWVGKGLQFDEGNTEHDTYNFAVSTDVLEHCLDPVAELNRIASCMRPGGILLLGTFFNSCNGHDPSHLDEHARFQDTATWFDEVHGAGFRHFADDPRGVPKLFEKV